MRKVKQYKEADALMMRVNSCATNLIHWLAAKMQDHSVYITRGMKEEFINYMGLYDVRYSKAQVQAAMKILCDTGLLIKTDYRGIYHINPKHFHNGQYTYSYYEKVGKEVAGNWVL